MKKSIFIAETEIEKKIFLIRGKQVMLDKDLAELYGVKTKALNQAVKRNLERFPHDFMFRLTSKDAFSRSQFVTLKKQGKNIKYLPYAFTEQGVSMLSSVLKSKRAILVNIQIMRAFTRFKHLILNHKEIVEKLNTLEGKVENHDTEIQSIFRAIRDLIAKNETQKRKVGFCINQ
jgi:hypothetical protein